MNLTEIKKRIANVRQQSKMPCTDVAEAARQLHNLNEAIIGITVCLDALESRVIKLEKEA